MNILMIYPEFPDTFWSFKHALRFVRKKASSPPLGLITVASMLPAEWKKRLVDVNIKPLQRSDLEWADLVFISAMVVQKQSAVEILQKCKEAGKTVVAGGPLFTSAYTDYLDIVDHFVLNEAEITLPQFLADLELHKPQKVYSTEGYCDLSITPVPSWDLVDL